MTLTEAMERDVRGLSDLELNEARAVLGDDKLRLRQLARTPSRMGEAMGWFRKLNARLDALNFEEIDRQSQAGRAKVKHPQAMRRF